VSFHTGASLSSKLGSVLARSAAVADEVTFAGRSDLRLAQISNQVLFDLLRVWKGSRAGEMRGKWKF